MQVSRTDRRIVIVILSRFSRTRHKNLTGYVKWDDGIISALTLKMNMKKKIVVLKCVSICLVYYFILSWLYNRISTEEQQKRILSNNMHLLRQVCLWLRGVERIMAFFRSFVYHSILYMMIQFQCHTNSLIIKAEY
jgi:hypothetical protein